MVIMAKAPALGRAKTRLAREIGPRAATICRQMLQQTFVEAAGPWRLVVAATPAAALHSWRRFWPRRAELVAQSDGDLGDRLRAVERRVRGGPIVFLGGDLPGLRRRHLRQAFRALGRADAVFGPAEDGGYWLVGLARRRSANGMFADVRWSTEHALADTRASLPAAFRVSFLETLRDVDEAADLDGLPRERSRA